MGEWRWIEPALDPAQATMDLDRRLFRSVKEENEISTLRFYRWKNPVLSYGRTQGIDAITRENALRRGWEAVQRPTGGGIVIHGEDLCFSLIWRKEEKSIPWKVSDSYCKIHSWIQNTLEELGYGLKMETAKKDPETGWCFQSAVPFDLVSSGKKMVGGAQWRDGNAALHQGSIQISLSDQAVVRFKTNFEKQFLIRFADVCAAAR